MLYNIKKFIKQFVYSIIPPPYSPPSFSQAGEDAIIRFLFADRKVDKISYLDIGTNIPDRDNNTFLFYQKGSRGVCVEANKALMPLIHRVRPEDKIINAGVSVGTSFEADFYVFDNGAINTFDKMEAESRASLGTHKIKEVVKVPLIDINRLIAENFPAYPDFLSIDIEGLDLAVLKNLDLVKYPIPVICVETCVYSENYIRPKDNTIVDFLKSQGYEIYGDTYINTIFVNKKWFYGN